MVFGQTNVIMNNAVVYNTRMKIHSGAHGHHAVLSYYNKVQTVGDIQEQEGQI